MTDTLHIQSICDSLKEGDVVEIGGKLAEVFIIKDKRIVVAWHDAAGTTLFHRAIDEMINSGSLIKSKPGYEKHKSFACIRDIRGYLTQVFDDGKSFKKISSVADNKPEENKLISIKNGFETNSIKVGTKLKFQLERGESSGNQYLSSSNYDSSRHSLSSEAIYVGTNELNNHRYFVFEVQDNTANAVPLESYKKWLDKSTIKNIAKIAPNAKYIHALGANYYNVNIVGQVEEQTKEQTKDNNVIANIADILSGKFNLKIGSKVSFYLRGSHLAHSDLDHDSISNEFTYLGIKNRKAIFARPDDGKNTDSSITYSIVPREYEKVVEDYVEDPSKQRIYWLSESRSIIVNSQPEKDMEKINKMTVEVKPEYKPLSSRKVGEKFLMDFGGKKVEVCLLSDPSKGPEVLGFTTKDPINGISPVSYEGLLEKVRTRIVDSGQKDNTKNYAGFLANVQNRHFENNKTFDIEQVDKKQPTNINDLKVGDIYVFHGIETVVLGVNKNEFKFVVGTTEDKKDIGGVSLAEIKANGGAEETRRVVKMLSENDANKFHQFATFDTMMALVSFKPSNKPSFKLEASSLVEKPAEKYSTIPKYEDIKIGDRFNYVNNEVEVIAKHGGQLFSLGILKGGPKTFGAFAASFDSVKQGACSIATFEVFGKLSEKEKEKYDGFGTMHYSHINAKSLKPSVTSNPPEKVSAKTKQTKKLNDLVEGDVALIDGKTATVLKSDAECVVFGFADPEGAGIATDKFESAHNKIRTIVSNFSDRDRGAFRRMALFFKGENNPDYELLGKDISCDYLRYRTVSEMPEGSQFRILGSDGNYHEAYLLDKKTLTVGYLSSTRGLAQIDIVKSKYDADDFNKFKSFHQFVGAEGRNIKPSELVKLSILTKDQRKALREEEQKKKEQGQKTEKDKLLEEKVSKVEQRIMELENSLNSKNSKLIETVSKAEGKIEEIKAGVKTSTDEIYEQISDIKTDVEVGKKTAATAVAVATTAVGAAAMVSKELNSYKQETTKQTKKENTKMEKSFFDMVKADAKDAAYRSAATQLTNATKSGIILLLQKNGKSSDTIKAMEDLLNTEPGAAAISLLLGMSLTYVPKVSEDPRAQRLAKEFRVNGMSTAINSALSTLTEYFVPAMQGILSGLPTEEALPAGEKSDGGEPAIQ